MIIICPECATRYQVDAAKFPAAGRTVKCAKCGHTWRQDAPRSEPVAAAEERIVTPEPPPSSQPPALEQVQQPVEQSIAPPIAPAPVYAPPVPTPPVRRPMVTRVEEPRGPSAWAGRLGLLAGWSLLAALLVLAGWAALHYRQMVVTAWPQTASLYAAIGKPVNPRGIEFREVSYKREKQDGQSVLEITGKLLNVSGREQPVPQIRAALSDNGGRELYHWTFGASVATMQSGQSVPFLTRISSPPPGARHLEVRFLRDGE